MKPLVDSLISFTSVRDPSDIPTRTSLCPPYAPRSEGADSRRYTTPRAPEVRSPDVFAEAPAAGDPRFPPRSHPNDTSTHIAKAVPTRNPRTAERHFIAVGLEAAA